MGLQLWGRSRFYRLENLLFSSLVQRDRWTYLKHALVSSSTLTLVCITFCFQMHVILEIFKFDSITYWLFVLFSTTELMGQCLHVTIAGGRLPAIAHSLFMSAFPLPLTPSNSVRDLVFLIFQFIVTVFVVVETEHYWKVWMCIFQFYRSCFCCCWDRALLKSLNVPRKYSMLYDYG